VAVFERVVAAAERIVTKIEACLETLKACQGAEVCLGKTEASKKAGQPKLVWPAINKEQ
jgi:hypothetical protein